MDFVINNWALIAVALVSGGLLAWPVLQGATARGISPAQAVMLINREKAVVVDVREPAEFAAGHVGGARNAPLGQLEQRLPEAVKNKAVPVLLMCDSGGRATRALATARKLGYEQAQVVAGGLRAWKEANLPVEKA